MKFADLLSSELANFMTAYLALPDPPNELQEFVEILPQSELAHQSRLASLVTSWKHRQRDPEATLFADKAYASRPKWLAVERIRVDRNLDQALELMLDQIETRGYFADAQKQLRLEELLVKSNVIKERSPRSGYNQALWANQINFARHVDESVALYRSEFRRQAQQE